VQRAALMFTCGREQVQELGPAEAHFNEAYRRLEVQSVSRVSRPGYAPAVAESPPGRGCPFKGLLTPKARLAGTSAAEHVTDGLTKIRA
jgi:hypothetical protein